MLPHTNRIPQPPGNNLTPKIILGTLLNLSNLETADLTSAGVDLGSGRVDIVLGAALDEQHVWLGAGNEKRARAVEAAIIHACDHGFLVGDGAGCSVVVPGPDGGEGGDEESAAVGGEGYAVVNLRGC